MKQRRAESYSSTHSLPRHLMGVNQIYAMDALSPGKNSGYPLSRRLGGNQSRSGTFFDKMSLAPITGIRTPDRPVSSASLYSLCYAGPRSWTDQTSKCSVSTTERPYRSATLQGVTSRKARPLTFTRNSDIKPETVNCHEDVQTQ